MKKICLNMIVKNEGKIIENALASLAEHIDYYIICDTGSSDDTPQIIRQFFERHHVPGEVISIEFRNFEYARNKALELAQQSSAEFDYILLTDADMEFRIVDPDFKAHLSHGAYMIEQRNTALAYFNLRLVQKDVSAHYVGLTHEYLDCNDIKAEQFKGFYFYDHANGTSRTEKYERDIKLLKEGLEKEPDNARYCFYLAQSYFDCNLFDEAKQYYRKRVALGGWEEEVYYSLYRTGLCEKESQQDEALILKAFMDCHNYRPQRAEPLYQLAQYYRNAEKYPAAYLFAHAAFNVPYPKNDILFVDAAIYTFKIFDELSIAAYWVGKYQESYDICEFLLSKLPLSDSDRERIEANLDFAKSKLARVNSIVEKV